MGKRGPKPKSKVSIDWSPNFAYAIGLLVTDGCLSKDGRHIDLTSNDRDQLENFMKALGVQIPIGIKNRGQKNKGLRVQFSDVLFYQFLLNIGLTPAKSKTIGAVKVPSKYFFDFLRGSFDGDGTFFSYWDPRWPSSFMFYTEFACASKEHILWIQKSIFDRIKISGHITKSKNNSAYKLKFAKKDSVKLIRKMYANKTGLFLKRKRLKIDGVLSMIGKF